ncbi:hypothetical protein ZL54_22510 [Salmonella enterica subsp. enterica]|nr:hypothetical protein [Salmonella enterica subsp. enterica]EEJ7209111.1 hypothetical protein [Salmonella enterica subsp. enterica]
MFRANEEAAERREEARDFLVPDPQKKQWADQAPEEMGKYGKSSYAFETITDALGPFVSSYPGWHPLIALHTPGGNAPRSLPKIKGLDHTRYMVSGFITCPYGGGDELIASVKTRMHQLRGLIPEMPISAAHGGWLNLVSSMVSIHASYITEELLFYFLDKDSPLPQSRPLAEVKDLLPLYGPKVHPILVWVEWGERLRGGKIPAHFSVPLMLARELMDLPQAQCSETWEDMRGLLLGHPHGARSSMFLDQLTVKQMRTMYNALMSTGAYDK